MSKLTKLEQETIILANEAEKEAEVFTYNKAMKKRLSALCSEHPEEFTFKRDNGVGGQTFIVPKKRIKITAPRTMTPEQKERARQNLKK